MDEEEQLRYQITPEGIALALAVEKMVSDGATLEHAADHFGVSVEQLQILFALMPNVTLQDVKDLL